MRRIGLFGGSFNPVHMAHLVLAERAREEADFEKVLFIPALRPPHKPKRPLAPGRHRAEMLRLALEGNPGFELCTVELDREGPSYTLQTVRELKQSLGGDAELCLIVGADSLLDMPNWWHADELVREVRVVGLRRPGYELEDAEALESLFGTEKLAQIRNALVSAPLLGISATEIRERRQAGRSIRYLVPEAVRRYILKEGLYAGP